MLQKFKTLFFLFIFALPLFSYADISVLAGAVMDTQGHPITGAFILVYREGEKNPVFQATTNDQGIYEIQNVPTGKYQVTCQKDGYNTQTKSVEVKKLIAAECYFLLESTKGDSGPTVGSDVFHIGKVDLATTRVYVAFGTNNPYTPETLTKDAESGNNPNELPNTTLPELGATLYGGGPLKDNPLIELLTHGGANDPNQLIPAVHPNSVIMLDNKNKAVAAIPTSARPYWIAFSPDGQRFWVVDSMHNLSMFSASGQRLGSVNVGDNLASDLAVSPDGTRVYLAMRSWPDPEVLVADGISNALVGSYDLPAMHGQPGGIAVSMDGHTLVVSMGTQGAGWLEVLDAATGQIEKEIQVGAQPMGVGVTPDGSRAVVACYSDGTVDVVDLQEGKIIATISTGLQPSKVAMRSDGRVAFVTNNGDNSLSVIDVAQAVELAKVPVGKGPMGVAITPDGKTVYVANSEDGDVSIIDGMTLAVLGTTSPAPGEHPFGIAVRP
jgi:YVTN family beta-propeller protein